MMDFANKNKTWMNPASTSANHCTSNKISCNTATNFSAAVNKIETLGSEIFVTVYNNTTVIDPMSKWVILDPDSIRIYEDDLLIYRYAEGFRYDTMYPANDPANAEYNDVDGKTQKKNIKVPDVKAPTPGEEFGEGEKGFTTYKGSSIDNTPISEIQFDVYHVVPGEGEILTPTPTATAV